MALSVKDKKEERLEKVKDYYRLIGIPSREYWITTTSFMSSCWIRAITMEIMKRDCGFHDKFMDIQSEGVGQMITIAMQDGEINPFCKDFEST